MREIEAIFFNETFTLLAQVETLFASLQSDGPAQTSLEAIFRAIHSIKSSAAALGFKKASQLAHALEDLLVQLRGKPVVEIENNVELIEQATGRLRDQLHHDQAGSSFDETRPPPIIDSLNSRAKGLSAKPDSVETLLEYEITLINQQPAERLCNLYAHLSSLGLAHISITSQTEQTIVLQTTLAQTAVLAVCSFSVEPEDVSINVRALQRPNDGGGNRRGMIRMGDVLRPMSRMLAELCLDTGKKAQLITQGDGIELVPTLAQQLIAPVAHLLRNCVAHGIESPQARQLAGKCELGQLSVTSTTNGSNLSISVADDGAGMNREQILQGAQKQGLPVENCLTDDEVWELALTPGLSTAAEQSVLSGRGVGLDSVKTTVAKLNGDFRIQSEVGLGTTMTIIVPIDVKMSG